MRDGSGALDVSAEGSAREAEQETAFAPGKGTDRGPNGERDSGATGEFAGETFSHARPRSISGSPEGTSKKLTGRRSGGRPPAGAPLPLPVVTPPSRAMLMIATLVIVASFLGAIVLAGHPSMRFAAIILAFLSGSLSVWRVQIDDRLRLSKAVVRLEDRAKSLFEHTEQLEDQTWELRESDDRQASILSTLGDVVIRRDSGRKVVYANSAALETFGDQIKAGAALTLPRADMRNVTSHPALGETDAWFGDLLLQTAHGPRWFSRIDISVRDPATGAPLSQTVLRDVTDRRMIEEELLAARHSAETSNEAKSRFLATVSHEIRTPLNGILGMAALLRDTRLTQEQVAYIEALETSGETLLLLIDEVLDFSKVEAGKLDIQAAPARLAPLTESVVELLAPRAHAKGLEIGARLSPALPATVTIDATRVRQILFNLTGNGVKFTDEGGVAIEIDGRSRPEGGSLIDITVRDTGIGFKPEEAERLFREFEQIDHGPARKFGGTGLGLAIAQRLALLMGGEIRAENAPNGGAVFRLSLPVPEELVAKSQSAHAPSHGRHIVIVSNGKVEAPLLKHRLEMEGATATLCMPGNGDLTESLLKADLLVVDNSAMADSGAWLATARLAGCHAPAVVLVAPPERDRLERLRAAGFAAYLIRPVRMDSLSQVLSRLLDDQASDLCWTAGAERPADTGFESTRQAPQRPLRLLVAEDNDINRLLSEALLRKLGHEPTMVVDGEKAVEAATAEPFDAILMDLHMPGLDGIGAIEQIRIMEQREGRRPVPILMVTADVMQNARERAAAVGAAGYLTKPLAADAIRDALQSVL
ncbi:PAS domain-containing hybrid sensor histidine kinase/response regulator [Roseibium suaedae]|uniref:Sensory/regulatory protein RpfC n=1 Tax=Roseibium suaedae TaxID=735517 RepID=A0A1M7MCJ1_9HYPH|nr:PAS domain-containing hybrid sensor histidine kinase/response regulator [Roseibium suaedae]SHM88566.1 PAS/PAC sensor hybrid histidine kinase [Roseibium suaedae]